jgi:hypothetical protein
MKKYWFIPFGAAVLMALWLWSSISSGLLAWLVAVNAVAFVTFWYDKKIPGFRRRVDAGIRCHADFSPQDGSKLAGFSEQILGYSDPGAGDCCRSLVDQIIITEYPRMSRRE